MLYSLLLSQYTFARNSENDDRLSGTARNSYPGAVAGIPRLSTTFEYVSVQPCTRRCVRPSKSLIPVSSRKIRTIL